MKRIFFIFVMTFIFLVPKANATSWKTCEFGRNCNLGDFVYDNNFSAYTRDICTINITHPNESIAVKDGSMDNHSDGWHNYTLKCNNEGTYKAEMFCINETDIGKLNRNFECIPNKSNIYLLLSFAVLLGVALFFDEIKMMARVMVNENS